VSVEDEEERSKTQILMACAIEVGLLITGNRKLKVQVVSRVHSMGVFKLCDGQKGS
jgi:hypothetical protein